MKSELPDESAEESEEKSPRSTGRGALADKVRSPDFGGPTPSPSPRMRAGLLQGCV